MGASNRAIAKETGAKFYMPPNPCGRCGGWLRRTDSGSCYYCANSRRKRVYHEGKISRDGSAEFCAQCQKETDRYSSNGNCKPCHSRYIRKHYRENRSRYRENHRRSHAENRSERNAAARRYYLKNKDRFAEYFAQYRKENQDRIRAYRSNPEAMAAHRERQRKICSTPEGKVAAQMRNSIHRLMSDKNGSASEKILRYSADELIEHLEDKFLPGMSWENYGQWHIDHIRPLSWFVAEGVTDPAIVNALSNLQPLWAADNIRKLNRYEGN